MRPFAYELGAMVYIDVVGDWKMVKGKILARTEDIGGGHSYHISVNSFDREANPAIVRHVATEHEIRSATE